MTFSLSDWFSLEVWRVALVFVRLGLAFMLLPGFGEPALPARIRLLTGLVIAAACAGAAPGMPDAVPAAWGLVRALAAEAVAGALIGVIARTVVSGVLIGGSIIGQNIGMANLFASGLGPDQSASIGAAIYAGLAAALFAVDGHHAILRAIIGSYAALPAGHFPDLGAGAQALVHAGGQAFRLGAQLAMPFLLLGLTFNVTLAVINRARPAMPVFALAAPALSAAGLYLLAATAPALLEEGLQAWGGMLGLLR